MTNVGAASSMWIMADGNTYGEDAAVYTRAGSTTRYMLQKDFGSTILNESNQTVNHDHTGTSGSSLSNITLGYADVILCTKN